MIECEMLFELEGEAPRVLRAGDAFWAPGGHRQIKSVTVPALGISRRKMSWTRASRRPGSAAARQSSPGLANGAKPVNPNVWSSRFSAEYL